jgi:hypothetical protein
MATTKVQFRGVYLDDDTTDALTTWTYDVTGPDRRAKLIREPRGFPTSIDPDTASIQFGSQTLEFARSTLEAETFEHRNHTPTTSLAEPLQPAEIHIEFADAQPFPDGAIVHIGWETIKLGAYDAGSGEYRNCTRDVRGFAATQPLPHAAGDPVFADAQGVPFWNRRLAQIEMPGAPTWYGVVRAIKSRDARLTMELDNYYSVLISAASDGGDRRVDPSQHTWEWTPRRIGQVGLRVDGYTESLQFENKIHKPDVTGVDLSPSLQLGGTVFSGNFPPGFVKEPLPDKSPDVSLDGGESKQVEEAAYQVLLVGSQFEDASFNPLDEEFDNPSHPITILRAFLESTTRPDIDGHDVLPGAWGTRLNTAGSAEATHPSLKIDHRVYGWDGEAVEAQKLLKELAASFGFTPVFDDGVLDFQRFGKPTVETTFQSLDLIPGTLEWDEGLDRQLTAVEARRTGLPWEEGRPVRVTLDDAPNRGPAPGGAWGDQKRQTFEYPTVSPNNAETNVWGYLEAELVSRLTRSRKGRPSLRFQTDDGPVEPGQWIEIDHLPVDPPRWLVDRDGNQFEVNSSNPLLGWAMRQEPASGGTQIVDALIFFGEPVKKRAPSMVVDSTADNGATLYTTEAPQFGSYDRATGDDIPDSETFQPGDDVVVCDFDLDPATGTFEVLDVDDDPTGPFIRIDGAPSVAPGQIVRLATFDDFTPPGDGLEHTYLAQADHTLGVDDADGHRYGL